MGLWNSHTSLGNIFGSLIAGAFVQVIIWDFTFDRLVIWWSSESKISLILNPHILFLPSVQLGSLIHSAWSHYCWCWISPLPGDGTQASRPWVSRWGKKFVCTQKAAKAHNVIHVFFIQDMSNENSETEPLLDEEDGDKEEEPTHSVDLDVQVPFTFLVTRAMPS